MRITLLAAVFFLFLHPVFAAVPAYLPLRPASEWTSKPKPHLRFKERKGTMGLVYGAVLGPVGYFGVKLFSRHNEQMQYQAGRGFKMWGRLITCCLVIGVCTALKLSNSVPPDFLDSLWGTP